MVAAGRLPATALFHSWPGEGKGPGMKTREEHIVFDGTPFVAEVFMLFARALPDSPDPRAVSEVFARAITAQLEQYLPPGSVINTTIVTVRRKSS